MAVQSVKIRAEIMEDVQGKFRRERKRNDELNYAERMVIESRVPSKWRFVDMETGEVYIWNARKKEFKRDYNVEVVK